MLARIVSITIVVVCMVYVYTATGLSFGTLTHPKAGFVHLDVRDETVTWSDFFHTHRDCSLGESPTEAKGGREITVLSVWNNESATFPLVTESGDVGIYRKQRLPAQ